MELSPGGGWYTEILAPLLGESGTLIAAHRDINGGTYSRRSLGGFLQKLAGDAETYENVIVSALQPPATSLPAAPASVTWRWHFAMFTRGCALTRQRRFLLLLRQSQPGGVFGVVQHRGDADFDLERMRQTAYVTEDKVIELAELAGFELAGRSEINANPADLKNYKGGVWTLPPVLREGEVNREKYLEIGESDRMTLRFIKPVE